MVLSTATCITMVSAVARLIYSMLNYYAGSWDFSEDTDKGVDIFIQSCFEAGPEKCAFHDESPEVMHQHLDSIYESLRTEPLAAYLSESSIGTYSLVDNAFLKQYFFIALYSPFQSFPGLARGLAGIMQGNATALYEEYVIYSAARAQSQGRTGGDNCTPRDEEFFNGPEATASYICNDSQGWEKPNTLDWAKEVLEKHLQTSSFGGLDAGFDIGCAYVFSFCSVPKNEANQRTSGWGNFTTGRFNGPVGGNTSFPILFVGNEADPITPYAGYALCHAEGIHC
jgi:hypothetical protein